MYSMPKYTFNGQKQAQTVEIDINVNATVETDQSETGNTRRTINTVYWSIARFYWLKISIFMPYKSTETVI